MQELDFPTRTVITNEATNLYTLLEVQTPDRLGLLYDLLRALGKLKINVVLSRIATEKGAAIDSFYVVDVEGEPRRRGGNDAEDRSGGAASGGEGHRKGWDPRQMVASLALMPAKKSRAWRVPVSVGWPSAADHG